MEIISKRDAKKNALILDVSNVSPAFYALLLQLVAISITSVTFLLSRHFLGLTPHPYITLLFHSVLALVLCSMSRLDWWWMLIEFSFPILLVVFLVLGISPGLYLFFFVILLLIFRSSFRNQVPYFPSGKRSLPLISEQFPLDKKIRFLDIGSGFGGVLIRLSRMHPDCIFHGVETAPLLWLVSIFNATILRSRVKVRLSDYNKIHLGSYDIVFAYLSPAVMLDLWCKVQNEMKPGALFISYEFIIPEINPTYVINGVDNNSTLYVWRI